MKNFQVLLFMTSIFVMILSCNHNSKPNNSESSHYLQQEIDSLDLKLVEINQTTDIPGFAANIISGDSIIYSKGFGYADLANKYSFTPQTVHTIASISKTFIGVAIMKLVEEGKLNLDAPVNSYLPFEVWSSHFPETVITVRHLVTHTSSLNDDFDDGEKRPCQLVEQSNYNKDEIPKSLTEDIFYYDGYNMPLEDYLKHVFTPTGKWYAKGNFSDFKPGEKYEYSNEGSNLAALIVEKVSGMPFSTFTQKYIFQPLEMTSTSWYYKELDSTVSKLYVLHEQESSDRVFEFPRFNEASYPCGDLKSNAKDLSKYLIEMMKGFNGKGKILSEKSYQTLLNSQLDKNKFDEQGEGALDDEYNVGVFWAISKPGLRLHKGGSVGVYSILYFNPASNLGVVSYCNLAHPDFGKIVNRLREFEEKLRKKPAANKKYMPIEVK